MITRTNRTSRGITLIEVLVIVAVLAVIIAGFAPTTRPRAKAQAIRCVSNLKAIGVAHLMHPANDANAFKPLAKVNPLSITLDDVFKRTFLSLSNQVAEPRIFICPADKRHPADAWSSLARKNLSYFASPDAVHSLPQSFLAGDPNLTTNGVPLAPGIVRMSTNSALAWDRRLHRAAGHIVLSDGSVRQFNTARLQEHMTKFAPQSFTLAIP